MKNLEISNETAKTYGIAAEDLVRLRRVSSNHALALNVSQLDRWAASQVKRAGQSVGIGDVVVPSTGSFAGIPLQVSGFGGSKLSLQSVPGFGPGPVGRVGYLVTSLLYVDGISAGIRIELPISER